MTTVDDGRILFKSCPLCGSETFVPIRSMDWNQHPLYFDLRNALPEKIHWMECSECEHVFTSGYFNEDQRSALMTKVQADQFPGFRLGDYRVVSGRIVDRIVQTFSLAGGGLWQPVDQALWLDVGFGNASLLLTAKEYGFAVAGLDSRKGLVKALNEKFGVVAFLDNLPKNIGPFSVISMADVLEHVPQPIKMLQEAYQRLLPQGLLFLSCPNKDCAQWHLDGNPYWSEIEHFHNFGRRRLQALLRESGFEPLTFSVSERYVMGMEIIARKVT